MSAAKAAPPPPKTPGILPLPRPVVDHHGATLFGPMREWLENRRIPPVLLLTGPSGVGKRAMVHFLSQWIFCEKTGLQPQTSVAANAGGDLFGGASESEDLGPGLFGDSPPAPAASDEPAPHASTAGDPLPCGQCPACARAIKGSWVDFTEILPETEDGEGSSSGTLKIDQFRDLKSKLGFGAHEGAYRVVSIPNADRMTTQAANSVLKLLEEPPKGWIFFLTASDPTLMLPTVVSRCQRLRLRPFRAEPLRELLALAGVETARQAICAELAQGSWNKALTLAEDENWSRRKTLFNFIMNPHAELNTLVDWAAQDPANLSLLVDQLEHLTGDLIHWTLEDPASAPEERAWRNSDGKAALAFHAKAAMKNRGGMPAAREFWITRSEDLARVRQDALAPLNRKLLIQDLLLPWLGGILGGRNIR